MGGWQVLDGGAGLRKAFSMEPETGQIVRSIPAPGVRTHGRAWDDAILWCVNSDDRAIYKLDPRDGKVMARFG